MTAKPVRTHPLLLRSCRPISFHFRILHLLRADLLQQCWFIDAINQTWQFRMVLLTSTDVMGRLNYGLMDRGVIKLIVCQYNQVKASQNLGHMPSGCPEILVGFHTWVHYSVTDYWDGHLGLIFIGLCLWLSLFVSCHFMMIYETHVFHWGTTWLLIGEVTRPLSIDGSNLVSVSPPSILSDISICAWG